MTTSTKIKDSDSTGHRLSMTPGTRTDYARRRAAPRARFLSTTAPGLPPLKKVGCVKPHRECVKPGGG